MDAVNWWLKFLDIDYEEYVEAILAKPKEEAASSSVVETVPIPKTESHE
jgi:hypothetical protein